MQIYIEERCIVVISMQSQKKASRILMHKASCRITSGATPCVTAF
jgi:hypothetical protein